MNKLLVMCLVTRSLAYQLRRLSVKNFDYRTCCLTLIPSHCFYLIDLNADLALRILTLPCNTAPSETCWWAQKLHETLTWFFWREISWASQVQALKSWHTRCLLKWLKKLGCLVTHQTIVLQVELFEALLLSNEGKYSLFRFFLDPPTRVSCQSQLHKTVGLWWIR